MKLALEGLEKALRDRKLKRDHANLVVSESILVCGEYVVSKFIVSLEYTLSIQ